MMKTDLILRPQFFYGQKMVESISLQLHQSINQLDIPTEFKQRFLHNYQNMDTFLDSSVVYDEWFNKYYTEHRKFIQGVTRELLLDIDYKKADQLGGSNVDQRKRYLISYDALKQLEMKCDKSTRKYYVQLERCVQKHIQIAIQHHQSQIQQLETQIEELKDENKSCSLYRIYNRRTGELLYIGKDKSQIQNRFQQHLTQRRKIVSNHQLIDIKLATLEEQDIQMSQTIYTQRDIDQEERNAIIEELPSYNQIQAQHIYRCQHCDKPYKSRLPFQKHESNCTFSSN